MEVWTYLFLFGVGFLICEVSFNILYEYKLGAIYLKDQNPDSIFNRVFYGLHFMGLTMAIMGMFRLYESVIKKMDWKTHGAKIDLSLFIESKKVMVFMYRKFRDFLKNHNL